MKRHGFISVIAALGLLFTVAAAQQFPRLQEENLNGQQVVLPDGAKGKVAVLVLGFSRSSQKSAEAWAKRVLQDFGSNPAVVLYQLPAIQDAPRFVRGMITSGMKKDVPEAQRATFVPVLHEEEALKKLVAYKKDDAGDDAYIVVLDPSGKVVIQTHGGPDASGYGDLHSRLQALLK
jgi:hypothetical protein